MADDRSTDFGYERVTREDKARRVRGVFDSVAENYDLMNDLMSAGAHRLWKRFTLSLANLRAGQQALDVAGGSGDLAAGMARQVGERLDGGRDLELGLGPRGREGERSRDEDESERSSERGHVRLHQNGCAPWAPIEYSACRKPTVEEGTPGPVSSCA